jgi:3-oxoacyl-[acyl-carrier-protein] synthase I
LDDALARAGLRINQVDHINLHGTASAKNDDMEAALVARRFGPQVHASSTKGLTGHALGAAGVVDAVLTLLALQTGWMPGTQNTVQLDPLCGPHIKLRPAQADVRVGLSHSFGFGGTNCVLAFARAV